MLINKKSDYFKLLTNDRDDYSKLPRLDGSHSTKHNKSDRLRLEPSEYKDKYSFKTEVE